MKNKFSNIAWVVFHGYYYSDSNFLSVFDYKKDAIKAIKEQGFKYNKQ